MWSSTRAVSSSPEISGGAMLHFASENTHGCQHERTRNCTAASRPLGSNCSLSFPNYMRPPIRLAALCKLSAIYVFTHDSIGLGEVVRHHQPIEQLAAMRAIPKHPCNPAADPTEVVEAWRVASRIARVRSRSCLLVKRSP
jgi:transketolase